MKHFQLVTPKGCKMFPSQGVGTVTSAELYTHAGDHKNGLTTYFVEASVDVTSSDGTVLNTPMVMKISRNHGLKDYRANDLLARILQAGSIDLSRWSYINASSDA